MAGQGETFALFSPATDDRSCLPADEAHAQPVWFFAEFHGTSSIGEQKSVVRTQDKALLYGVTGGIPLYASYFDGKLSAQENIRSLFSPRRAFVNGTG